MNPYYWAAYNVGNMRCSDRDGNLSRLRNRLNRPEVTKYAIFRELPGFHSTTQVEFLVEHKNDQYFIKQGIESK